MESIFLMKEVSSVKGSFVVLISVRDIDGTIAEVPYTLAKLAIRYCILHFGY